MKMNKKTTALLSAFTLTLSFVSTAFAAAGEPLQQAEIRGRVIEKTESSITVDNQLNGAYKGEFILRISGDTEVLDWESGSETASEAISEGEMVKAFISPIVTASLPPQSTASIIYADYRAGWALQDGEAGSPSAVWVYYDEAGSRVTGWLMDQGKWYYMDPETGIMQRGFIQADGKTYYMQADGSMLTEPKLFTPDETGALR